MWTSKQYQIDVKEVLGVIKSRETFMAGERLMEFQKRSLAFTKEFHFLKIYLSSGMEFYDALALAFQDPIMSYIISYEDMDCLFDYLDRKTIFWSSYINKQVYSFAVILITLSCNIMINYLFQENQYIYSGFQLHHLKTFSILIYYILILIFGYIIATLSVFYIYKNYCNKYVFLQYFDHKISLTRLFSRKRSKDILTIINQLEQKKIYKKNTLLDLLNIRWKIVNLIPAIISFLSVVLALFCFLLNIIAIFKQMIAVNLYM